MLRKILVGDNERVLVIRKRRFETILGPGEQWLYTPGVELIRANLNDLVFTSEWTAFLLTERPGMAAHYFTVVETSDAQVAVVYLDGKLARVIAPGKRVLFWCGSVAVTFELIDVREDAQVPERLVAALARLGRESLASFTLIDEGKRVGWPCVSSPAC